jgi:APA family basic amino acid/polyamine antiporter
MAFWARRKPIDAEPPAGHRLQRTLSWPHLIALGVGAIVGTGIYTLIGVGAGLAGPGVIVSFAIAGAVCVCVALAYAELAAMMPASGSAYTYSYSALGEGAAWLVGWALILEYSVVVSAVAVGWSGYATSFLAAVGVDLPVALTQGPHVAGGMINLPAIAIIVAVAGLLLVGTRESATINAVLVAVKLAALLAFLAIAAPHFDAARFEPFMPFGFAAHRAGDATVGVMAAAAIIFFAFYGFDAVSTAAEETKNPGRDLAIGIVGSMALCTALYMAVAAAAIGAMDYGLFASSTEPLAYIVRTLSGDAAAAWIAGAAVVAIPTVVLAFLYGQSRIFFVMARDGLLPRRWAALDSRTGAPLVVTLLTVIVTAGLAGFLRLDEIAALANAGTLAAFVAVAVSLLALRRSAPDRPRPFRAPLAWFIAPAAMIGCAYLFISLPLETIGRFFIWMALGAPVYLLFGARESVLARP